MKRKKNPISTWYSRKKKDTNLKRLIMTPVAVTMLSGQNREVSNPPSSMFLASYIHDMISNLDLLNSHIKEVKF